jgi:hypothetical protein
MDGGNALSTSEEEVEDVQDPAETRTRIKPTKAELEIRVAAVQDVLLLGLRPKEIWRYLTEKKNWKISQRTVDRYIQLATKQIVKAAALEREYELGRAKKRLDHLYQRNIAIQDFKAALAVVREMNALLGLNEPIKTELTGATGPVTFLVKYEEKKPDAIPDNPPAATPEAA